jgi:hypothetical protein
VELIAQDRPYFSAYGSPRLGPDRPPCDYWATAEVTARLRRDLNCPDDRALWKCLGVDKFIHLVPRHPRAAEADWHLQ